MLAALSLGGLNVVQKQSNVDRTRRTIQKIHFLLMEKLEEYQTKRVEVDTANLASGLTPQQKSIAMIQARVVAIHDLMRLEMPDRLGDVGNGPIDPWIALGYAENSSQPFGAIQPSNRFARKIAAANNVTTGNLASLTEDQCANMSAELLYMIIMSMPNSCEQFAEYEIADTNDNGLKEFVDAWGEPIRFLRWAPGLDPANSDIQTGNSTNDPSPFDPNGYYRFLNANDGYILYPLVFSSGPDKKHGVNVEKGYVFQGNPYRHTNVNGAAENNAGEPNTGADTGNGTEENYPDNITNHMLDFGKTF